MLRPEGVQIHASWGYTVSMPIPSLPEIIAIVLAVLYVLAIISALEAILRTRTSQGAIAWAISLITFPVVSLLLYAVFGRNKFRGYVDARRAGELEIQHIAAQLADKYEAPLRAGFSGDQAAYGTFERLAKMPFTRCNEARLLIDGEASFEAIFDGIRGATDYVLVQFFIIRNDALGNALRTTLVQKARQGVRVYLLYDEIGCHKLPASFLDALSEAGVRARPFRTTRGRANRFQINFRNHRKVVVVDGHTAYVGGHNVGEEYLGKHPRLSPWRPRGSRPRAAPSPPLRRCLLWGCAPRRVRRCGWSRSWS